jgi:hypothetical protein
LYVDLENNINVLTDGQEVYVELLSKLNDIKDQLIENHVQNHMRLALELLETMARNEDLKSLETLMPDLNEILSSITEQADMLSSKFKDEQTAYFEFVTQLEKESNQLIENQLSSSVNLALDLLDVMESNNDLESLEALMPELNKLLTGIRKQANMLSNLLKDDKSRYLKLRVDLEKVKDQLIKDHVSKGIKYLGDRLEGTDTRTPESSMEESMTLIKRLENQAKLASTASTSEVERLLDKLVDLKSSFAERHQSPHGDKSAPTQPQSLLCDRLQEKLAKAESTQFYELKV